MAIKVASYLKRNRFRIYHFRRIVPPDLRLSFRGGEISRSTGFASVSDAVDVARQMAASVELLFYRLREMKKKTGDDMVQFDYTVDIQFEKDGTVKNVTVNANPDETEAIGALLAPFVPVARGGAIPSPASSNGVRVFDEMDKYLDERTNSGKWTPQTAQDIRGDFGQFKLIMGDVLMSEFNHHTLNRILDTFLKLPANVNKDPELKGKTIDEILAFGKPPQSRTTTVKKWTRMITFGGWLEGKGLIDRNYAKGKKPDAKAQS